MGLQNERLDHEVVDKMDVTHWLPYCLQGVDSTPYYNLCMRAYCTASVNGEDKADLARCNVLDMFAQNCYKEAAMAIRWRSQDFCRKSWLIYCLLLSLSHCLSLS